MPLIKRLDHVIIAVRDRPAWIPLIQRVLALQPGRMLEAAGLGSSGFSNAEFAIGDGFLGVVTPAGESSQLNRFLDNFGEGFYGASIDVGDPELARATFERHGIDNRVVEGGATIYAGPRRTHGVLFQVIGGMHLGPGSNPRYLGLAEVTIAVHDLEGAVSDYDRIFEPGDWQSTRGDPPGTRGAVFPIAGLHVAQSLALVAPEDDDCEVARHLASRGEGMYSFAIACSDIQGELARLAALEISTSVTKGGVSIDPRALGGVRVDLRPA